MDLHTWLDLPENAGKAVWLADQLGRSKAAVSLWRTDGVPMPLIRRVAELVGDPVTIDCMLYHALACKTRAAEPAQPTPEPA